MMEDSRRGSIAVDRRLLSMLTGVVAGVVAFAVDFVPAPEGGILGAAVSSGFSWGLVSFAVGYFAPTRRVALIVSVGTLALAVTTYYSFVLLFSDRWHQSSGASSLPNAFSPVTRALMFWMAGALLGGLFLGWLAYGAKTGSARSSGIAFGVAIGALIGEAAYAVFHFAFIWVGPLDAFVWTQLQPAATQLCLAAIVAIVALWIRRRSVSPLAVLAAGTISTTVSVALWYLIQAVRTTL
ncbi:hypothetical protein [Micromonospora sp. LOL_024]|uniref:hypothetical protein n=1 Tax=Micromonospora sp. LOL_024 TaxID=3345412 RepID=UPI003A89A2E7